MIEKYIKGDIVKLFEQGNDIAHGCNCFHTMGAGVAGQLSKKFNIILEADKQSIYGDYSKLGKFTSAVINENFCFNLYTQYEPGPNVDYGAIFNAFLSLNEFRRMGTPPLYIPLIGAGIAGGDWFMIEKLIQLASMNYRIIVVDYHL